MARLLIIGCGGVLQAFVLLKGILEFLVGDAF